MFLYINLTDLVSKSADGKEALAPAWIHPLACARLKAPPESSRPAYLRIHQSTYPFGAIILIVIS